MRISSVVLFLTLTVSAFGASVVYDSIPSPLPPNYPSLGYQATSTRQAGDAVGLAGTARILNTVTVGMSSWALKSSYPNLSDPNGYYQDLTLNLYETGAGDTVGNNIASLLVNAYIPYRPEASAGCGTAYNSGGNCYNGMAFTVDFNFSGMAITLPDNVIVGLAFNTNTHGYQPMNAPGPYESLNFGLSGGTTVGTDLNSDKIYWDTTYGPFYADGGAGGTGTFRADTGWAGYVPALRITADEAGAVPEPGTMAMLASAAIAAFARASHHERFLALFLFISG